MLNDKRVLITGGSRGIGEGIVRMAIEYGAHVAFTYHQNKAVADRLVEEMAASYASQRCMALQCDVVNTESMRDTTTFVTKELGTIDVLVNNAGITRDAAFGRMTRRQWDEVMDTNLGGLFNATQPLMLQFVKKRAGAIVNITSFAGIYGSNGQANYAASKAGIIGFTKSLAKELAPFNVRVNAVAPGFIETDMISVMDKDRLEYVKSQIPMGRLGRSEEVAQLACFLASDRASYITGEVIQANGGLTL